MLAQMAGFFEGEGCISIGSCGGKQFHLMIRISNTCTRPLLRFSKYFGGKIRYHSVSHPNGKLIYGWICPTSQQLSFLKQLGHLIEVRPERVKIANQFIELKSWGCQGRKISARSYTRRKELYEQMKIINKTGRR